MPQALQPLMMNMLTAAMFVASFLTIAYLNKSARRAQWIALSYFFGVLEPLAELAIYFGAEVKPMTLVASGSFLIGLTIMSPALSLFHGRKPMWGAVIGIIVGGVGYRVITLDAPRGAFWYEMGFQPFYAVAMALCAYTMMRHTPANKLNHALAILFGVTSFHFLLKPIAASYLGKGVSERDYAGTLYAVLSQASSGLLLIGAGLLILISVLQAVVQSNFLEARRDPLTGLPNRRALHEKFLTLAAQESSAPLSLFVAVIDIDHFKKINDQFGHDAGDEVLQAVGKCLDDNRPSASKVARIGGEEFVLLLPGQTPSSAMMVCESLRLAIAGLSIPGIASITASLGLTNVVDGEDLADSLRRADRALYDAKDAGRNQCKSAFNSRPPKLAVIEQVRTV